MMELKDEALEQRLSPATAARCVMYLTVAEAGKAVSMALVIVKLKLLNPVDGIKRGKGGSGSRKLAFIP